MSVIPNLSIKVFFYNLMFWDSSQFELLSFVTIWDFEFCCNLSFEFLQNWSFCFLSQFVFLSFCLLNVEFFSVVKMLVFLWQFEFVKFCHNLSFWVFSQFEFLSFFTFSVFELVTISVFALVMILVCVICHSLIHSLTHYKVLRPNDRHMDLLLELLRAVKSLDHEYYATEKILWFFLPHIIE